MRFAALVAADALRECPLTGQVVHQTRSKRHGLGAGEGTGYYFLPTLAGQLVTPLESRHAPVGPMVKAAFENAACMTPDDACVPDGFIPGANTFDPVPLRG